MLTIYAKYCTGSHGEYDFSLLTHRNRYPNFSCQRSSCRSPQAAHIPVHLGSMPDSVACALDTFDHFSPGDIIALNDPFLRGTHLPDITLIVDGLLTVTIEEQVEERWVRAYGNRPGGVRVERALSVRSQVDAPAVEEAIRSLGWRVYATNQPKELLPLEQAILACREECLVERGFGRLKGKPLSLSPMYVQSDQCATGLVRLLSICLRVLTLLEFSVGQHLADTKATVGGLYVGNPKRTTNRPTAEALLGAFKAIHLSLVTIGQQLHRHVTPLSEVQKHLLALLDLSPVLYEQLCVEFPQPT